jgi:hypothetical protein
LEGRNPDLLMLATIAIIATIANFESPKMAGDKSVALGRIARPVFDPRGLFPECIEATKVQFGQSARICVHAVERAGSQGSRSISRTCASSAD